MYPIAALAATQQTIDRTAEIWTALPAIPEVWTALATAASQQLWKVRAVGAPSIVPCSLIKLVRQ